MTVPASVLRLVAGVTEDQRDFAVLHERLQAQFAAVLRHDSATLVMLATDIGLLCEVIEARRRERVELVAALVPAHEFETGRPVEAAFEHLPERYRAPALAAWRALGEQIVRCKQLNVRNCELLMGQREVMAQARGDEVIVYGPR